MNFFDTLGKIESIKGQAEKSMHLEKPKKEEEAKDTTNKLVLEDTELEDSSTETETELEDSSTEIETELDDSSTEEV